jgi:hypothetical protein
VRGASARVAQDDERLRVELLAGDGPAKQQPVGQASGLVSVARSSKSTCEHTTAWWLKVPLRCGSTGCQRVAGSR